MDFYVSGVIPGQVNTVKEETIQGFLRDNNVLSNLNDIRS